MYRMLIVDDEEIERNALRMIIERFVPDVQIVGEAENGRYALEMVKLLQPDLVTMDIKMPGIDGIEAVKILHGHYPATRFIMVSAFDEFEYARRVMKFGVKEYLVKPCKKEQIVSAVNSVVEDIEHDIEAKKRIGDLESKVQQANTAIEAELVIAILMDHIQDVKLEDWKEMFGIEKSSGGYAMVVTLSDQGSEIPLNMKKKMYVWLRDQIKQQNPSLVGPMSGVLIPSFVFPEQRENSDGHSVRSRMVQFARDLINRFERVFAGNEMNVGIGTMYPSEERLVESYHEALLACQNKCISRLTLYEDLSFIEREEGYAYPQETEKQLLRTVKSGDLDKSILEFERYLNELLYATHYNLQRVKHDLDKLFSVILQLFTENGMALASVTSFQHLLDEKSLREHAKFQMRLLVEKLNLWYAQEHRGGMQKAKEYIAENFSKELSLEEVAEHVQLSPFYFSKLFHEQCGVTFIDYLTGARIERARELLSDPKQTIKEIGIQVGYRDPNYFSRVFKKTIGFSPTEYRITSVSE